VLIDLIGYRRFGHNESDEPAYTQPEMYTTIKGKKRVAELWADRLVEDGVVSQDDVERQDQEVWDNLTLLHQRLKAQIAAAAEHERGDQGTGEQLTAPPAPTSRPAVPAARPRALSGTLRAPEASPCTPSSSTAERRREDSIRRAHRLAHARLAFASLLTKARRSG
jgi:2-oxoglutarate dehydrogenase E1 component